MSVFRAHRSVEELHRAGLCDRVQDLVLLCEGISPAVRSLQWDSSGPEVRAILSGAAVEEGLHLWVPWSSESLEQLLGFTDGVSCEDVMSTGCPKK